MANNPNAKDNLKPFEKGDKRINRKGRAIRGFDALRKEWQDIWSEIMFDGNGQPIIDEVTGKALTRLRGRMRIATSSRNHQEFRTALEYAYGKPKEEIDLSNSDGSLQKVIIEYVDSENTTPAPASGATSDKKQQEKI